MVSGRLGLACCKVYISTTLNPSSGMIMKRIEQVARSNSRAPLLHKFEDEHYNRVGYTLAGECSPELTTGVVHLIQTALEGIDLREQSGTHPRLGVVDNVCFHPLGDSTLEQAALLATGVARRIGDESRVPAFVYGHKHESLDSIRRRLGYFTPSGPGQWGGSPTNLSLNPSFGPAEISPRSGVIAVGACPWISNYNIPLITEDLEAARRIARWVSERGGGLPRVQAMALLHGNDCIEIACNLIDELQTSSNLVQERVESLAKEQSLEARAGYFTNLSLSEVYGLAIRKLSPPSDVPHQGR